MTTTKSLSISLIMTTSPAPWHPSTETTENAIRSYQELLGFQCRPVIGCDGVPDYATTEDKANYLEYLWKLERLDVADLRTHGKWVGHAGALASCFDGGSVSPLILAGEDDEIIIEPQKIDTAGVREALMASNPVQCVRLCRHDPFEKRGGGGNYKVIRDLGIEYGVPLLANRGWATSAHFATHEFYQQRILPNLESRMSTSGDGRGGCERLVWTKYRTQCKQIGEFEAWNQWGVCLYWREKDKPQIKHCGRDRARWRRGRTNARQD